MPTRWVRLIKPVFVVCCALALTTRLPASDALERENFAVFYDDDKDYALAIYEYKAASEADLIKDNLPEHSIEFSAYIQPPDRRDIIGFRTHLIPVSAKDADRKDMLVPDRKRKQEDWSGVLEHPKFRDRRNDPLKLAQIELKKTELQRPPYTIDELGLEARALLVEDREEVDIKAIVADEFIDIGYGTRVRVTAIEVKGRGEMTITLDVKRKAGDRSPVIDSVFALNEDREVIGGGRWTNELDIFADTCEYEMKLLLTKSTRATQLRVVLATDYEIVRVPIIVERLFQK